MTILFLLLFLAELVELTKHDWLLLKMNEESNHLSNRFAGIDLYPQAGAVKLTAIMAKSEDIHQKKSLKLVQRLMDRTRLTLSLMI